MRSAGVSQRFACRFQTDSHFADEEMTCDFRKGSVNRSARPPCHIRKSPETGCDTGKQCRNNCENTW